MRGREAISSLRSWRSWDSLSQSGLLRESDRLENQRGRTVSDAPAGVEPAPQSRVRLCACTPGGGTSGPAPRRPRRSQRRGCQCPGTRGATPGAGGELTGQGSRARRVARASRDPAAEGAERGGDCSSAEHGAASGGRAAGVTRRD